MNSQSLRKVGVVLLLAVFPVSAAFAQSVERVHYWNGESRVELDVALDELSVSPDRERNPGVSEADLPADVRVTSVGLNGEMLVELPAAASDVAGLNVSAGSLRARGFATGTVLYSAESGERSVGNRRVLGNTFSVRLNDGDDLNDVLSHYGLEVAREITYSPDTYILRCLSEDLLAALEVANAMFENGEAVFATPLLKKQQFPRAVPDDTHFGEQWHLQNTGQVLDAVAGNDVNIIDAWDSVMGAGINIAVTDSGVEVAHEDLSPNARTDIDLDINGNDDDPTPTSDNHGTRAAGIAAAKGNNTQGVAGSGYDAGIVGIRLIEAAADDSEEAEAMAHQVDPVNAADRVHINTNSWGPTDNGANLTTTGPLTLAAIENGIANGRGGLGTIYTWAVGNGRQNDDNVNYDGYASSRYTIAVGASGGDGLFSFYSEEGASMLLTAPSSYGSVGTTTVTTGGSNYTSAFGGTSSACPLVAGIVALMLEANPNLTWRDVQHVLVDTSTQIDVSGGAWQTNGSGRVFSHAYGFGRVDATAAVTAASTWTNVPDEATPVSNSETGIAVNIPDNDVNGVDRMLSISAAPDFFTEFVEVTLTANHTWRGDLRITLISPDGTESELSNANGSSGFGYSAWLMTSVAHWGEDPNGTWTLNIADEAAADTGTITDWELEVYGYVPVDENVYVDFSNNGAEDGSLINPFNTLAEGLAAVADAGTVHIAAGATTETATVNRAVTLVVDGGGTVTVGSVP